MVFSCFRSMNSKCGLTAYKQSSVYQTMRQVMCISVVVDCALIDYLVSSDGISDGFRCVKTFDDGRVLCRTNSTSLSKSMRNYCKVREIINMQHKLFDFALLSPIFDVPVLRRPGLQ